MSGSFILKKATVIFLLLPFQLFAQNDFSTISQRIVQNLQEGVTEANILKQVAGYQPLQRIDGSWSDINYNDSSITAWKPGDHLDRLKSFAIGLTKPDNFYQNSPALKMAVLNGLRFWYAKDPQSKNWWHNEIASPQSLGEILLIMQQLPGSVPASLQDSLVRRMERGNMYDKTGANKLDIALHNLYRAAVTKDDTLMNAAVSQAFEPIRLTTAEGIQFDNSYQQHGAQLQISSYGYVFLTGEYKVASWVQGTAYALSKEKLNILDNYFINSFLRTIRGRYIDFNTEGRGISRPDILDKFGVAGKKNTASIIDMAKQVNPANTALLDTAALRLTEKMPAGYGIQPSHTHFWKGDYSIHLRKQFSFNVRTVSTRTKRTEAGNKENIFGKFLPDGSTNIQRTGSEYYNIMPVWEWDKIPGITSRDFAKDQPTKVQWGEDGSTQFVGGVSDSVYGATTYTMDYNDVKAKKSYFFFDNEVVCLGAGINSSSAERIVTTVNQSWLQGKAFVSLAQKNVQVKKSKQFLNPAWAWQDSIGYFFPGEANVFASTEGQSGSWAAINASRSKDEVKGDVFKLWIDHGANPQEAKYAYIVVPGISLQNMPDYAKNNIMILENSTTIQAVRQAALQTWQIVFHEAGKFSADGFTISADKPCILMINAGDAKNISLHVADPAQTAAQINLQIQMPGWKTVKEIHAVMPQGNIAGSSVALSL